MTLDFIFKTCTGHDTAYWADRGDLDWFSAYADPREDAGKGILVANWNEFPRKGDQAFNWSSKGRKFQDLLERAGYQLEWRDQTDRCNDCNGCIRTDAQYYGDTAHYALIGDCDIVCEECIRKNCTEEYLEGLEVKRLSGPFGAVNIRGINPAEYGYKLVQADYENGFHPGQNDNPKEIYKVLDEKGYEGILFKVDDSCQFDTRFSVWAKNVPTPRREMKDLDSFTKQYIATALWSSTDDDGNPLDSEFSSDDIAPESLDKMIADCADFQAKYGHLISEEYFEGTYDIDVEGRYGHDFWLTRNGHGAGFWDGDYTEPQATELTKAAKSYGQCDLNVGVPNEDGERQIFIP